LRLGLRAGLLFAWEESSIPDLMEGSMPVTTALVRPPGDSYANAISSTGAHIDVAVARAQHAEYCQALAAAGVIVEVLPPDEDYPDSCFMQDPAMVIAGQAIICRPGAPSRRGEEVSAAEWLGRRLSLARILAPGTLEGGDVLVLPDRVLVGESARSNAAGIRQLGAILAPCGLPVDGVAVGDNLHLLSGLAYLGANRLLAVDDFAALPIFAGMEVVPVPPDESYAANVLALGDHVIVPAGYPRVAGALRACGLDVLPVPVSEFAKADGGVTCLSLLL
jgi:dimethylargininase